MAGNKNSGPNGMFTPELGAKIVAALKIGAFKRHAAHAAGIHHRTLENWLARGELGEEPYAAFARDAEAAIAEDALRNQSIVSQAAARQIEGDWKAAAWNLQKKHPALYGRLAELQLLAELERERARAATAQSDPSAEVDAAEEKPYSPWKTPEADAIRAHKRFDS